jgi:Ser/Thr protein kinase RdoA (MazF antagonist)
MQSVHYQVSYLYTMLLSESLALRALANFPIQVGKVSPLRRSENLTWRVEDQEQHTYLLRIHQSTSAALAGTRQRPNIIQSELEWLSVLHQCGMPVQRPLRSNTGKYVAVLEMKGLPVPCTLLTWLEGEDYDPSIHANPAIIENFARLTAFLHSEALLWTVPKGFTRPTYNVAHFEGLFSDLRAGVKKNLIAAEDWVILRRTCERLLEDIRTTQDIPGQWGLIHADLHSGNLLVRGKDVLVIDFSLCGYGSFLFDISIALVAGVPAEFRQAYLSAYRRCRPLPDELLPLVEAYGLAGVLSYCAFQVGNPEQWEWLTNRIPRLAAGECHRYLNNQPIYLE